MKICPRCGFDYTNKKHVQCVDCAKDNAKIKSATVRRITHKKCGGLVGWYHGGNKIGRIVAHEFERLDGTFPDPYYLFDEECLTCNQKVAGQGDLVVELEKTGLCGQCETNLSPGKVVRIINGRCAECGEIVGAGGGFGSGCVSRANYQNAQAIKNIENMRLLNQCVTAKKPFEKKVEPECIAVEDVTDPDLLRKMVVKLWQLLDDIDTLDDSCRDDDLDFRNHTRKYQQRRHAVLHSDGYNLFFRGDHQDDKAETIKADEINMCPMCQKGALSISVPQHTAFYDSEEPDEKYWAVEYYTGHCYQCGKTSFFELDHDGRPKESSPGADKTAELLRDLAGKLAWSAYMTHNLLDGLDLGLIEEDKKRLSLQAQEYEILGAKHSVK
ncbi:hypothetical protein KAR91_33785 [Candidatus Pacearchaeota archaeon]|nr:hypothetical protein [Candidatus Pacearchaeota archaeon]